MSLKCSRPQAARVLEELERRGFLTKAKKRNQWDTTPRVTSSPGTGTRREFTPAIEREEEPGIYNEGFAAVPCSVWRFTDDQGVVFEETELDVGTHVDYEGDRLVEINLSQRDEYQGEVGRPSARTRAFARSSPRLQRSKSPARPPGPEPQKSPPATTLDQRDEDRQIGQRWTRSENMMKSELRSLAQKLQHIHSANLICPAGLVALDLATTPPESRRRRSARTTFAPGLFARLTASRRRASASAGARIHRSGGRPASSVRRSLGHFRTRRACPGPWGIRRRTPYALRPSQAR
jgi:hypothetical protein